jgi:hypothetical protein
VAQLHRRHGHRSTTDDDVKSTFAYDAAGELVGYCPAKQVVWAAFGGSSCNVNDPASPSAWH